VTPEGPSLLVVGAGSAGRRHAAHLLDLGARVTVADIDPGPLARCREELAGPLVTTSDPDAALEAAWDGIVVASPSGLHAAHARAALGCGRPVLVEKPLAVDEADARELAGAGGGRLAVAYNLRFCEPVRRFVGLAHEAPGRIVSARIWFGHWLPAWRPGTDWRSGYSARRDLGGGVLLDASHELDLLRWLFGPGPYEVLGALVAELGPLEIDVEDTVGALLRAPGGFPVSLSLDYLSRRYRRGAEVVGVEGTVRIDWARQVVEVEGPNDRRSEPAVEPVSESYRRQAAAFASWVGGGPAMPVDGGTGAEVVALASAVRAAAGVGAGA